MKFYPYLYFDGNTEEVFSFYRKVFQAPAPHIMRFKEMPASVGFDVPPELEEKILHITLALENGGILMGSDTPPGYSLKSGNNFTILIDATSDAEAERLFNELGEGGEVRMAFERAWWGPMFGMVVDRFGVCWMINSDQQD